MRKLILPVLAALCLVLALNPAGPVNAPAERAARDAAEASIVVYVALRSINAALSLVQEIEVGGSFGLSANAQPMKILEPIDDTVERVAGVVFAVALFAGAVSLGIGPVASLGFLLLALGLIVQAVREPLIRYGGRVATPTCRAGSASIVTGAILALALPLSLALGNQFGEAVTAAKWQQAEAKLQEISGFSRSLVGEGDGVSLPGADQSKGAETGWSGWFSGARDKVEAASEATGYFMSEADELLGASLILVSVFLLRTLVLPLAFLAVAIALLRQSLRG